jgi:hypothetical protein
VSTQSSGFTPDPNDPLPSLADERPVSGHRRRDDRPADPTDPAEETEPNHPVGPSAVDELDPAEPHEPVGNDNIREGRVGGVMGGPRQQQGQGQGG